jgi:hypothetical protein
MAGGFGYQKTQKNNLNKNELAPSSQGMDNAPKFSLKGILNLGQSIEINKTPKIDSSWTKETLFGKNYLQKQEETLIRQQQGELQQEIKELTNEIKKLVNSAQELETEVEKAAIQTVTEINQYQIGFLKRIKKIIISFNQNISESGIWMSTLNHKKQKKNAFWGNVKNKKNGGEQYLMSSEHSASRSAN